jgi:hypothetical protein
MADDIGPIAASVLRCLSITRYRGFQSHADDAIARDCLSDASACRVCGAVVDEHNDRVQLFWRGASCPAECSPAGQLSPGQLPGGLMVGSQLLCGLMVGETAARRPAGGEPAAEKPGALRPAARRGPQPSGLLSSHVVFVLHDLKRRSWYSGQLIKAQCAWTCCQKCMSAKLDPARSTCRL